MTAGYTHDVDACVEEINRMAAAGADLVRVAVPERKDTAALPEIIRQTRHPPSFFSNAASRSAFNRAR